MPERELVTHKVVRPVRLAVLISGGGRTLRNLLTRIESGELRATVCMVISSRPGVRGLSIAAEADIPAQVVTRTAFDTDQVFSNEIYRHCASFEAELIICAGFLKRLVVPPEWEGRILNIHPALIPESGAAGAGYFGDRVHRAVIESGALVTGATVHVVDNEYDHGPIVLKQSIPVRVGERADELAARVFEVECELYPRAIQTYINTHPGLFG